MPIQPVSGEIKAQPLNENFSYLDSKTNNISKGSPAGTYATLALLQNAFPNGNTNIYVVSGTGNWYYWNGTSWTSGGKYQETGIADNSVDEAKATKPTIKATLIVAYDPPNYDTSTKTLTFNGISGAQDIILWGRSYYLIPPGLSIVNDVAATSAYKLVFDIETKIFRFVSWGTTIAVNELLIMSYRINSTGGYLITADFPLNVNGYSHVETATNLPVVSILGGGLQGNNLPKISSVNKTINFPGGYDWIFAIDGVKYANAIPSTGLTIDLSNLTGTSAFYIIYNISNKEIFTIPWGSLEKYAKGHALLGTIRVLGSTYSVYLPFPYLLDGKLFGYIDESQSSISVSLDAPIKCIHHRGYSRKYPENTESAYKGSKKIGVNEVEMDLVFTSDEVPVNLHDMTINRTARNNDGTEIEEEKNITEITYEEAAQYDYGLWKGAGFKGQKLMSFEDAILICKKLDMRLHIDRASAHNSERLNIVKEIMDRNNFDNVLFYGYDVAGIDRIRSIFPNSSIVYLLSSTDITETVVDACVIRNQDGFCGVIAYAPLLTAEGTTLATSRGVEVYVWGADSVNRSQLSDWGVTGISTDFANIQEEFLNQ